MKEDPKPAIPLPVEQKPEIERFIEREFPGQEYHKLNWLPNEGGELPSIAEIHSTPLEDELTSTVEQGGKGEDDKNSEMLKVAMALVRSGWQMACDEILLWCSDRKISPEFIDQLLSMMDKEKKRQFDWVNLRAEMEKMGIEHLMPKTKNNE